MEARQVAGVELASEVTRRVVRIATRSSELALRQARIVESALLIEGFECELVTFKTRGVKKLTESATEIGAPGRFTHELDVALAKNKVDCCVHSLEDLPAQLLEGVSIAAIPEREDPRDVLVINPVTEADDLAAIPAGSRVGTSSLRRRAQLLAARPDLEVVELRGDVPTRLKKVETGKVHAAILGAAELIRLGASQRITQYLEPPDWLPAAGQGATAVEIRSDDEELREGLAPLDHQATARAVRAERAFVASLQGGYGVPIGALARSDVNGKMTLHAFVSDLLGRDFVRGSIAVDSDLPEMSGAALAAELRTRGATSLLLEVRSSEQMSH